MQIYDPIWELQSVNYKFCHVNVYIVFICSVSSENCLREVCQCWAMTERNSGIAENGSEVPPYISPGGEHTVTILTKCIILHK